MTWPDNYASIRISETQESEFLPVGSALERHNPYLWMVPKVHHALADQSTRHRFPPLPSTHEEQRSYWEGALYLVTLGLGWTNPGLGLNWWYESGKPTDDPLLRLLSDVWDNQGQLERFAAWLWAQDNNSHNTEKLIYVMRSLPGVSQSYTWSSDRKIKSSTYAEEVARKWSQDGWEAALPLGAGYNELHLGLTFDYLSEHITQDDLGDDSTLYFASEQPKRVVMKLKQDMPWYSAMYCIGEQLNDAGSSSWHADVIVEGWGYMGTWRRSMDTGLWFLGKHSTHLEGN